MPIRGLRPVGANLVRPVGVEHHQSGCVAAHKLGDSQVRSRREIVGSDARDHFMPFQTPGKGGNRNHQQNTQADPDNKEPKALEGIELDAGTRVGNAHKMLSQDTQNALTIAKQDALEFPIHIHKEADCIITQTVLEELRKFATAMLAEYGIANYITTIAG